MFKVSCFYHKVHDSLKFLEYAALLKGSGQLPIPILF